MDATPQRRTEWSPADEPGYAAVQADLAEALQAHIATKVPGAPVFSMPPKEDVAAMLRADLAEARAEWLKAAQHDPAERQRRTESDFLLPVDHEGEVLDFHTLRHTCGAWLAKNGCRIACGRALG